MNKALTPRDGRLFQTFSDSGAVLEIWPNGNSGIMLFYPGTMLAPGHYLIFLSALYQAGFGAAALHFPGHGRGRRTSDFTFASLLEEGLLAEEWLRNQGLGPAAVCGHSQGGILALAHAGKSRSLKAAFSICAVFPKMAEAITLTRFAPLRKRRRELLNFIKLAARVLPKLPIPLPLYLNLGKILAGRRKPVLMGREKGRISYPLAFLASLFDAEIGARLNCPYWLFAAVNDALFTTALTEAVFQKIQAPAKTLVWLEDGGHMAVLNPALAGFIAKSCAASCSGLGMTLNLRAAN